MRSTPWLAAAALALACNAASAAPDAVGYTAPDGVNVVAVTGANGLPMRFVAGPYALLANASATGFPVGPIVGATYEWCTTGTFGGATLALKALGPDGVTYLQVATQTSAGCTGVVLGQNAQVEVTVTGGTPSALYSSLS
jgi:hypothetical protein